MISRADILRWTVEDDVPDVALGEAVAEREVVTGQADELVATLADRMARADIGRVPIIDSEDRLIGLVARKDLLHARARLMPQESDRAAPLRQRFT
jgi:CBS domain-containing protein